MCCTEDKEYKFSEVATLLPGQLPAGVYPEFNTVVRGANIKCTQEGRCILYADQLQGHAVSDMSFLIEIPEGLEVRGPFEVVGEQAAGWMAFSQLTEIRDALNKPGADTDFVYDIKAYPEVLSAEQIMKANLLQEQKIIGADIHRRGVRWHVWSFQQRPTKSQTVLGIERVGQDEGLVHIEGLSPLFTYGNVGQVVCPTCLNGQFEYPGGLDPSQFVVFDALKDSSDTVSDRLTKALTIVVGDDKKELGFAASERERAQKAWKLHIKTKFNAELFSSQSLTLYLWTALIALLTTLAAVLSTSTTLDCDLDEGNAISGIDLCLKLDVSGAARTALAITVAVLPLMSAFLRVSRILMHVLGVRCL